LGMPLPCYRQCSMPRVFRQQAFRNTLGIQHPLQHRGGIPESLLVFGRIIGPNSQKKGNGQQECEQACDRYLVWHDNAPLAPFEDERTRFVADHSAAGQIWGEPGRNTSLIQWRTKASRRLARQVSGGRLSKSYTNWHRHWLTCVVPRADYTRGTAPWTDDMEETQRAIAAAAQHRR